MDLAENSEAEILPLTYFLGLLFVPEDGIKYFLEISANFYQISMRNIPDNRTDFSKSLKASNLII
jgi:hypothetical protein